MKTDTTISATGPKYRTWIALQQSSLALAAPAVVAVIAFFALIVWVWPFTMDDAFISFRYAKHLGDGLGPIWNLADDYRHVEGYTSFLHVWILGGIRFLTGIDLVILGKVLGVLAVLALALSVIREVSNYQIRGLAAFVVLSFLVVPFTALHAVSGMETGLFLLLNWLCALACVRLLERPAVANVWKFVLLGLLATLTRPEFGAAFLLMSAFVWWRVSEMRTTLIKALLVAYALPGLLITGWRYSYYGDLVPNAFYVKQERNVNIWGAIYVGRFYLFCALPYMLIAANGWRSLWEKHRSLLIITSICVITPSLYFLTTSPLMGWWYRFLLPQLPLLAVTSGLVLHDSDWQLRFSRASARLAGLVLLFVLPLIHVPLLLHFIPGHFEHEVRYREVGKRLNSFAAPDRWVVYNDVGSIVYESEWNTVDVVGLNTHKSELRSPCEMQTEILIRYSWNQDEIENPCPEIYVIVADLPFFQLETLNDSYMRVFGRSDITDIDELRLALIQEWPEQYKRSADWLTWYWRTFNRLLFQG